MESHDYPMFLPFQTTNGVPQESKLATYMNRANASTPVMNIGTLNQSFSGLNLTGQVPLNESPSPISMKKLISTSNPITTEFIPTSRNTPLSGQLLAAQISGSTPNSANFYNSFPGLSGTTVGPGSGYRTGESPHSITCSPHLTPHSSPPPGSAHLLNSSCSPSFENASSTNTSTTYQENVGGTTYFFSRPTRQAANINGSGTAGDINCDNINQQIVGDQITYQVYPGTPSHLLSSQILKQSNQVNNNGGINLVNGNQITQNNVLQSPSTTMITSTVSSVSSSPANCPSPVAIGTSPLLPVLKHQQRQINQQQSAATTSSYFVAQDIRQDIINKNALTLAQSNHEPYPDLPAEVDNYHELVPLEPIINGAQQTLSRSQLQLGYATTTYKATNIKSGVRYCLKRVRGFRLQNTKCMLLVDMWKSLMHSNVVHLREVFTTKAFSDNSIVFVYDYHPGAETLFSKHFSQTGTSIDPVTGNLVNSNSNNAYTDPFSSDPNAPRPYSHTKNVLLRHQQSNGGKLPENVIWNYVIQLTSALRVIHAAGLACRLLDATKVIITNGGSATNGKSAANLASARIRISGLGISDILLFDANSTNHLAHIPHYQQEDLISLGKLVLSLATKSTLATMQRENIATSLELVSRLYTPDLKNLIMYLLSNQTRKNVNDLMPMIGARFYTQLDTLQLRSDLLENEVAKEMENGRLLRLLVKLGTINERPEFNLDSSWSETGDRYLLKLFRDYLFHQVTEDGRPFLDLSHVVQCLNKLDAGIPENVQLTSRDEQSCLIVTYAELKKCLEQSFNELLDQAQQTQNGCVIAAPLVVVPQVIASGTVATTVAPPEHLLVQHTLN